MEENDFDYKTSQCETTVPWFRPDPYNLSLWRNELFSKIKNFEDHKLWLTGASIEGLPTWDVDIIVTGQLKSESKLQEIIKTMVDLGFKHRLLIDPWWCHDLEPYIKKGNLCKKMQIACQEVIDTGNCSGKHCQSPRRIKAEIILASRKTIKSGKILKEYKTAERLSSGLWGLPTSNTGESLPFFSKKHKKKLDETLVNKTFPILINKETVFYNYMQWP